jgi:hypothetical protein
LSAPTASRSCSAPRSPRRSYSRASDAPAPAHAVTNCPPGSGQILINVADDIVCINNNDRSFAGTNTGPGVFNKEGIPVIYVNGPNVKADAFFLANPIDTGFFNYDLFFRPTGSGIFELRSFVGQGAFVLPQLITASQDLASDLRHLVRSHRRPQSPSQWGGCPDRLRSQRQIRRRRASWWRRQHHPCGMGKRFRQLAGSRG